MQAQEIYEKLKAEFGDAIIEFNAEPFFDPFVQVTTDKLFDICLYLRDTPGLEFDYLSCLGSMDYKENLGVVYHLYSIKLKHTFVVKVTVSRENPVVPTVERIWRTADWHEREAWDMMGIQFEGHHNLIRILCPYDWENFPLRKDYVQPDEYHGMKVPY